MPGIVLAVGKRPSCSHGVFTTVGEVDTKYMDKKYLTLSVVRALKENNRLVSNQGSRTQSSGITEL